MNYELYENLEIIDEHNDGTRHMILALDIDGPRNLNIFYYVEPDNAAGFSFSDRVKYDDPKAAMSDWLNDTSIAY